MYFKHPEAEKPIDITGIVVYDISYSWPVEYLEYVPEGSDLPPGECENETECSSDGYLHCEDCEQWTDMGWRHKEPGLSCYDKYNEDGHNKAMYREVIYANFVDPGRIHSILHIPKLAANTPMDQEYKKKYIFLEDSPEFKALLRVNTKSAGAFGVNTAKDSWVGNAQGLTGYRGV